MPKLTNAQQEIYDHLQKGLSVDEIADKMRRPIAIISAQCTRMENKGVTLPRRTRTRPPATGSSSNEQIVNEAAQAGQAEYDPQEIIDKLQEAGKLKSHSKRDVHPMILLGVTIQFMKMCGGRMHAHQMIEDVYGAVRDMVDFQVPTTPPDTASWPPKDQDSLETLKKHYNDIHEKLNAILDKATS